MQSARHPSPLPLRLGIVFVTLLVVWAPSVRADRWYQHYDAAKKALASGEWAEAITQLEEALKRRGDSGAKVRTYGMNFDAYFPHLKLGIAYYRMGQHEAALQAFQTEEVLGAIQRSQEARAELENYRSLARKALDDVAAEEQQRIRQILADSLKQAGELEAQGQLKEAINVLGQGMSVAPDDPEAVARLDQLRQALARRQQEEQAARRAQGLVDEGRGLLAAGRFGEASTALQRALSLGAGDEASSLLETAQQRLRGELERAARQQDAAERAAAVAARMREATDLEAAGQLSEALGRLQSVIALDPAHAAALAMQRRILDAQAENERETERREDIRRLLEQAEAEVAGQRFADALTSANRVLALDSQNATALALVLEAHRSIRRGLLGGERQNVPPAISFADLRAEEPDGSRIERVTQAAFQLTGLVIDESPVRVVFEDSSGEIPGTTDSQPLGEYFATRFTLKTRLAAGPSVFRLVATDEEGLAISSEYAVIYTPPFFRTPGFYVAVSAAVLALAGAIAWRRHRRRQRLLKRRFNPYVAGAPVLDEDLFMGRDQLVDRILQTVHNNSLLLYGERRIGKTSLQHHLKKRLLQLDDPEYEFFPVYIDLQGTPEDKFFATLAEDTFHELEPLLDGLEPGRAGGGQTQGVREDKPYTHRDLVRDLRGVIKKLKARAKKKVKLVLLIDEVDELNEYDPKINQKLRSLFMKSFAENLVSVVSGVAIKKQWQREGSPWYNFFEEIEVKPFRRADAEELIEKPIRGIFKLEDGLTDRIIEITSGKPYLIQKLCIALVNRLYEQGRRRITLEDVEAVGRPPDAQEAA